MGRGTRLGAVIGGVAAVVMAVALVMAPASAEPPEGADPPPDPPPTRPRPTTTTLPRTLDALTVTTDSAVATASVRYIGSPGVVTVDWGDGTVDSRNPDDPSDPGPSPSPDPPGTITFRHAYTPPVAGEAFAAAVTARSGVESKTVAVIVTPRYQVDLATAQFRELSFCDTEPETFSEWTVERHVPPVPDKSWQFDSAGGIVLPLSASAVSFEMVAGERKWVDYRITERDPIDDDFGTTRAFVLEPVQGDHQAELNWHDWSGCEAEIRTDVDMTLIVPAMNRGPVARQ
jgi:hypothetical protein